MDQAWKEQNQQIIWVWIQLFQLTVEKHQTIMAFIDQKTRLADNAKYMKFIFEYLNYRETLCVCVGNPYLLRMRKMNSSSYYNTWSGKWLEEKKWLQKLSVWYWLI